MTLLIGILVPNYWADIHDLLPLYLRETHSAIAAQEPGLRRPRTEVGASPRRISDDAYCGLFFFCRAK